YMKCYRTHPYLHPFPTRRSSDLDKSSLGSSNNALGSITESVYRNMDLNTTFVAVFTPKVNDNFSLDFKVGGDVFQRQARSQQVRSEEHTSELQSRENLVCRLLLE